MSGVCTAGMCAAPSCTGGIKNGAETDVDCGGPACSKCALDRACVGDNDGQSAACDGARAG